MTDMPFPFTRLPSSQETRWQREALGVWYEDEEEGRPKTKGELREEYPSIIIPDSPKEYFKKVRKLRRMKRNIKRTRPLFTDILHLPDERVCKRRGT